MLPKPPPREPPLGFLYLPPYRVQGTSIAGEATCIQIPELDICFDMGICPRAALPARYVALSHGHMDHVGGLAYWCSQRRFQGMGTGTMVCSEALAPAVREMMQGFNRLEGQVTPYELISLPSEGELEIKNNIVLRGFETEHSDGSFGYAIVEKRSKLRDEYAGLPQEKLRELKSRGEEITRILEVPLIACVGDTSPGPHLLRNDVRRAQIIISECTFFEPEHRERARIGNHMHIEDVVEWLRVLECRALVLAHISRRTKLTYARKRLEEIAPAELLEHVHFLMDHRANRDRYERQLAAVPSD